MNVERKVVLSCVYESYWDMLPPEIQAYILAFKVSQERIDEDRAELMSQLRQEISMYALLKKKWGWGHVRCVACKMCGEIHRPQVYGHFVDTAHVKRRKFLGHGLSQALARVNEARRFLF